MGGGGGALTRRRRDCYYCCFVVLLPFVIVHDSVSGRAAYDLVVFPVFWESPAVIMHVCVYESYRHFPVNGSCWLL